MAISTINILSTPAAQQLFVLGTGKYYSVLVPTGSPSITFSQDAQGENVLGTAVAGTVLNFTSYDPPFYSSASPSGATVEVSTFKLYNPTTFTTVTNTTTETTTVQLAIPANVLFAASVLKVTLQVASTGVTGTPTLGYALYLGTAGNNTDTALYSVIGSPVTATSSTIGTLNYTLVPQAAPSGTTKITGTGYGVTIGAAGGAVLNSTLAPTAFATNGLLYLTATLKWSAASASNIGAANLFLVEML